MADKIIIRSDEIYISYYSASRHNAKHQTIFGLPFTFCHKITSSIMMMFICTHITFLAFCSSHLQIYPSTIFVIPLLWFDQVRSYRVVIVITNIVKGRTNEA